MSQVKSGAGRTANADDVRLILSCYILFKERKRIVIKIQKIRYAGMTGIRRKMVIG